MDIKLAYGQPCFLLLYGHGLILPRHILDAWKSVLHTRAEEFCWAGWKKMRMDGRDVSFT